MMVLRDVVIVRLCHFVKEWGTWKQKALNRSDVLPRPRLLVIKNCVLDQNVMHLVKFPVIDNRLVFRQNFIGSRNTLSFI